MSEQQAEQIISGLSFSFGIPTDQITHWDALPRNLKMQIARGCGVGECAVLDYAWIAMPADVREKLIKSTKTLFERGTARLRLLGDFLDAGNVGSTHA